MTLAPPEGKAMSQHPFMPIYWGDFLADTLHLDRATAFSYLLLIAHYWCHGGLPDDPKQLATIARLSTKRWSKTADTLSAFFHDGWHHKRIDEELAKARAFSEKQRRNANGRWLNATGDTRANGYAKPMPARALPHPHSNSSTNEEAERHTTRKRNLKNLNGKKPQRPAWHQARSRWEADLNRTAPDVYAESLELLSAHPRDCDRITAKEQRQPGSGALAALIAIKRLQSETEEGTRIP
jgi:uncharacterized protein YdaU (DUF1376 family)